jgi:hypothetical protein
MIKHQKQLMISRLGGIGADSNSGPASPNNRSSGDMPRSVMDLFPSSFQSSHMPLSLCVIQIYNLAVFHVPKYKNVFLVSVKPICSVLCLCVVNPRSFSF